MEEEEGGGGGTRLVTIPAKLALALGETKTGAVADNERGFRLC
jgi:hypothetical protein